MAVPTFVANGTFVHSTGAGVTPGMPSGWAVDDILVIFGESNGAVSGAISGWSLLPGLPFSSSGTSMYGYWRRAVAGDTSPTTPSGGNHQDCTMFAFRGCATVGDPWDTTMVEADPNTGTSTTRTASAIITGYADELIVVCFTQGVDSASSAVWDTWAAAGLTSVTEREDNATNDGDGGGIGVGTGIKATAGSTGTFTAKEIYSSARGANFMMGLRSTDTDIRPRFYVVMAN